MQNGKKNNTSQQSGFWFGLIMGGVIGSAALYMLGTKGGRKKMREVLDAVENFDGDMLREFESLLKNENIADKVPSFVTDISQVLDKIQSTLPVEKEVQKYFAKDGKMLK